MSGSTEAFRALEDKMITVETKIAADLEVVYARIEKLLATEPESEMEMQMITVRKGVEEDQKMALMQCLSLCRAAIEGAKQTTGHAFMNNQILGEARAAYGNIGNVPVGSVVSVYEGNTAGEGARVVMGNMDSASFLEFMR